jgi:hypothetical protein
MVEFSDGGIPKRKLTLQFQPLGELVDEDDPETDEDTPRVADGTEIELYVETVKEIFQKEPTYIPIQRSRDGHYQGDKTQVVDSLKTKHKFEIAAWVYSGKQGRHSLEDSILTQDRERAQVTSDKLKVREFGKFLPLGDTEILKDSEEVRNTTDGTTLTRGQDYEMNYAKGEIKFLSTGSLNDDASTTTETTEILGFQISETEVISDDIEIDYEFNVDANNIGKLVRRMSQLGNPLVMRLDEKDLSNPSSDSEFRAAHNYLVVANKVTIAGKSEKPDETKLELELRKGSVDI